MSGQRSIAGSPGPIPAAPARRDSEPCAIQISAGIATAVGSIASLYGTTGQAQTAKRSRRRRSPSRTARRSQAQNEGFTARMQAGLAQTAAQTAASQETLQARSQAANTMRAQQMKALQDYQDTLNAQNTQAETLRATGDTAAQQLLAQTSAPALADAQTQRQQQAAALLAPGAASATTGPQPTSPSGNDAVSRDPAAAGAMARRTAEAATNIRDYGSKIGTLSGYAGPGQAVGTAIAANQYGIMPAQTAERLLTAGSATRLLPSQVGYQSATGLGSARDLLEQSSGQGALDAAGLSYGNATDIANLRQSNESTTARNIELQKQADLEAAKPPRPG